MGALYTLLSFGRRLDYCSRLGLDLSVCEYSMTDRQLSSMSAGTPNPTPNPNPNPNPDPNPDPNPNPNPDPNPNQASSSWSR